MAKNKLIIIIALCVFFLDFKAFSAPCYGTRMPKQQKVVIGAQSYLIIRRYLRHDYGKLRSLQHFYLLSYGVFDWLSLDLKGGCGSIKQHPNTNDQRDYPSSFAGGYGFRIKFLNLEKLKAVLGFQHISVHPEKIRLEGVKHKGIIDDWQWSVLCSYNFNWVTPYLGTRYSRMDYIHWVEEDRKRKMSDSSRAIGMIVGVDIPFGEHVWFNCEGQFFDVEAAALSLNYEF